RSPEPAPPPAGPPRARRRGRPPRARARPAPGRPRARRRPRTSGAARPGRRPRAGRWPTSRGTVALRVDCLSPDQLLDFAEGRLDPLVRAAAERHLDGCDPCRSLLVEAARGGSAAPAREKRYRIERPIGGGAMGVVYSAWDQQLERRV